MSRRISLIQAEQAAAAHEGLSRFVRRVLDERRLALRDVELRAAGEITCGHIVNILAGDTGNLRIQTLEALARGLGVAEERLFAVARGLSGDNEFQESDFLALFRRYESLSEAEKPEIDALLETVSREIEQRSSQIGWQHLEEMITFLRPITLSRRMTLGEYVRRVLDEKRLTLTDVQLRSGGRISRSYIHQITGGQIKNLTVEKIRGLAAGLGVAEDEVFRVARDMSSSENPAFQMSALAKLYRRYEGLSQAGKKELRPLVEMLNREIDWRNMLAIKATADKAQKSLARKAAH